MKPIQISSGVASRIQTELDRVNGNAKAAVMNGQQVVNHAVNAERRLLELIRFKKFACGASYTAQSGERVSYAYGYRRVATRVKMERRQSGWWLIDISKCELNVNQGGETQLLLTTAQDQLAVKLLRGRYAIARPLVNLDGTSVQPTRPAVV